MMASKIFIDKIDLSYHGGVEKNTLKIQENLMKRYSDVNTLHNWKGFFKFLRFLLLNRNNRVSYFSFKSSALRCLLITLLFPRVRLFIRVNNSPEAYLFWRGVKSLVSFSLRIFLIKRKNIYIIFNSKAVMDFYAPMIREAKYLYLPNYYDEAYVKVKHEMGRPKVFAASRLSPEKRFTLTLRIFSSLHKKMSVGVNFYTSSNMDRQHQGGYLLKGYDELDINYNDIYLSLSAFEGMPNMAIEALLSGARLVLSNCWAHTELKEFAKNFSLADRVKLLETIDQQHIEEVILLMEKSILVDEVKDVKQKLTNMGAALKREFNFEFDRVCSFIDD